MNNVNMRTRLEMSKTRGNSTTVKNAASLVVIILLMQIMVAPVSAATSSVHGQHSMTGTIAMIDHTTGMLTLKTAEGDLQLHFPPPTVQTLKQGDTITVHLSYSQGSAAKQK